MNEYLIASLFSLEKEVSKKEKQLEELVKKLKGKVLAKEQREEDLAYPIAKQTKVWLSKLFFALEPEGLAELKKEIEGNVEPIRYLIVKFPYSKAKSETENEPKKEAKKKKAKTTKKNTKVKLDKALEKILKE